MVHAGWVFVAGIHPSRTCMSGSFESMQWNACVHRLDFSLYSHPKEFWGNGVRTYVNSKGKIHSTGSLEKNQTGVAASCKTARPTHYLVSYSSPRCDLKITLTASSQAMSGQLEITLMLCCYCRYYQPPQAWCFSISQSLWAALL